MPDTKDRRALNRIIIPSSELFYKPITRLSVVTTLIGPTDLINISKSGACFSAKNPLSRGSDFVLKVVLPLHVPILIKANTVWVSEDQEEHRTSVGVQFKPYGKGKKYNSYESKEALEEALNRFNNHHL